MDGLDQKVGAWTPGMRFCVDPGHYAGRPPNIHDINSKILEGLYDGISRELGDEKAVNFVRFVNALDDMSASSFAVAFRKFWANDCMVTRVRQHVDDRTAVTPIHGDEQHTQIFSIVARGLVVGKVSEDDIHARSQLVKGDFIRAHLQQIPLDEHRDEQGQ